MKGASPTASRRPSVLVAVLVAVVVAPAVTLPTACGTGSDDRGPLAPTTATNAVYVISSFYPLQFVAAKVGGDRVMVANLTPPGAEPHDVELTGDDTASLQDADLVVFLSGFTPALDEAIEGMVGMRALDVAWIPGVVDAAAGGSDRDETRDDGPRDLHFWLDPTRLASVAVAVAGRLSDLDADGAPTYRQNAATLSEQLAALDAEFVTGLAGCSDTDIVTSHEAFGYLADRYGFSEIGISGLSTDDEPSAADLADITDFVKDGDVRTIYSETLIDPAVAETLASETGAAIAVLDPIEGLTDDSRGTDYFEIMRSNLSILRAGQGCQ